MTCWTGAARKQAGCAPGTGAGPAAVVLRASILELAPLPTAPGCARLHAAAMAREWGLPGLAGDCALVVSEMVASACAAAAAIITPAGDRPPVRLTLAARPRGLLIEVWDASGQVPGPAPAPLSPGVVGEGWPRIGAAIAASHGAYRTRDGGKTAWAILGPAPCSFDGAGEL